MGGDYLSGLSLVVNLRDCNVFSLSPYAAAVDTKYGLENSTFCICVALHKNRMYIATVQCYRSYYMCVLS